VTHEDLREIVPPAPFQLKIFLAVNLDQVEVTNANSSGGHAPGQKPLLVSVINEGESAQTTALFDLVVIVKKVVAHCEL
jgi:hypothetical protein